MKDLRIAIIGAGIGGLTLALALQRFGLKPRIFEQAPELTEVGAGLSLPPNVTRVMEYLGLGDFLASQANHPLDQYVHHYQTGDELIHFDRRNILDEYGARYYQIHRADLQTELKKRVLSGDNTALHLGYECLSCEADDDRVTLQFTNNEQIEADLAVACDGLRSTIRQSLFDPTPVEFTGHIAWRGLIPAKEVDPWFTEPASHTWAGPGRLMVHYPIRGRDLLNCVAFTRSDAWQEEGWSIRADIDDLKSMFADYHPRVADILSKLPADNLFKWGLFARKPLEAWSKGPVTLLGDAAHPMLPYFGLGAGMAIEDGIILARTISASSTIDEALTRYEAVRRERAAFIQAESNLGGERLQQMDTDQLAKSPPRGEDSLGVFHYDASTVDI